MCYIDITGTLCSYLYSSANHKYLDLYAVYILKLEPFITLHLTANDIHFLCQISFKQSYSC